MKKFLFLLLLLPLMLLGCGSIKTIDTEEIEDGAGNTLLSKEFLSTIEDYDQDLPIYISEDFAWLENKKITEEMNVLNMEEDDYGVAEEYLGKAFHVFQVEADDDGNIFKVNWLLNITEQPKIELMKDLSAMNNNLQGQGSGEESTEQISNGNKSISRNKDFQPTRYAVHLMKKESDLANDAYADLYIASWSNDPRDEVIKFIQYPPDDNASGGQYEYLAIDNPSMAKGYIEFDANEGDRFQLWFRRSDGKVNYYDVTTADNNRPEKISLDKVKIIKFNPSWPLDNGDPNYVFKIDTNFSSRKSVFPSLKSNTLQAAVAPPAQTKKVRKKAKPYPNGHYWVDVTLLKGLDKEFYDVLASDKYKDIDTDDEEQDYVKVDPLYLKAKSPETYEQYKNKVRNLPKKDAVPVEEYPER